MRLQTEESANAPKLIVKQSYCPGGWFLEQKCFLLHMEELKLCVKKAYNKKNKNIFSNFLLKYCNSYCDLK
jgi:hypothetical protein